MPSPHGIDSCTFGFNSEVSHKGLTYHVQTESMVDETHATINTLVYLKGALVKKLSSPCRAPNPGGSSLEERVKHQHLDVLARIKRGELIG